MLQTRGDPISSGGTAATPGQTALVLAGGKALGAFEAGAYRALHDKGIRPDWMVGASIGAVNGAIIAGNPVERRIEALRRFWVKATLPSPVWTPNMGIWGEVARCWAAQAQAMIFGSPAVFMPNPAGLAAYAWPAPAKSIGLYDLTPLRRSLEELVDFELLNRGDVRLTIVTVDLETGEEVLFDTRHDRITPQHILASGAMLGEFPPVEIEGRLFVDGGLRSNLPIDVLQRDAREDVLCFAVDLFSIGSHRFRNIVEAAVRRQELLLAGSGLQFQKGYHREEELRRMLKTVLNLVPEDLRDRPDVMMASLEANRPEITLLRLVWSSGEEIGVNTYDWSDRTLTMRWQAGELAATEALRTLKSSEMRSAAE